MRNGCAILSRERKTLSAVERAEPKKQTRSKFRGGEGWGHNFQEKAQV